MKSHMQLAEAEAATGKRYFLVGGTNVSLLLLLPSCADAEKAKVSAKWWARWRAFSDWDGKHTNSAAPDPIDNSELVGERLPRPRMLSLLSPG